MYVGRYLNVPHHDPPVPEVLRVVGGGALLDALGILWKGKK
jgi:hypothetical protein